MLIESTVAVLGIASIIINGFAMKEENVIKAKVLLGLAVLLVIPDFYTHGGIHGSIQSIIIVLMCFLGAFEYKKAEKMVLYFIPFFSTYLLFGLQELSGIVIVIASVTTSLATTSKDPKIMKLLLSISTICWGAYSYLYGAWFAFAFDVVGLIGLIIFFINYKKKYNYVQEISI